MVPLDDSVSAYLPEMKGSAYDGVTIRQLLTMSSGVRWNEDYSDPTSDVARMYGTPADPGLDPITSFMRKLPREAPAGTKWNYKTGETDLAGVLLVRATGKPLAQYASEKLWKPLGMAQGISMGLQFCADKVSQTIALFPYAYLTTG